MADENPSETPFKTPLRRGNPAFTRDLTQRLVRSAAIELLRGGQRPTVHAVRSITKRGSTKTINECLGDIFIEAGNRLAEGLGDASLPKGLPPAVVTAVLRLWETAHEEARRPYEARLAALADKDEAAGAAVISTRLADEARELLAQEAAALREQVVGLNAEVGRLKKAATALERRRRQAPRPRRSLWRKASRKTRAAARLKRTVSTRGGKRSIRPTRKRHSRRGRKR